MVDIDDLSRVSGAQFRWQDLHVAGQHDHIRPAPGNLCCHLREVGSLVILVHGGMVVGNIMPVHITAQFIMVRDHTGDIKLHFTAAPAVQKVRQAVGLGAGH